MYNPFLFRSFAYLTITERLPYIVTKAVDTLHRHTDTFFAQYGQVSLKWQMWSLNCNLNSTDLILGRVQNKFARMLAGLKDYGYVDQLEKLQLFS